MKKISAIAAVILIALAVEVVSYFFLLMISFDQWELPVLGMANHWLFLSPSGLAVIIILFIAALWPTQPAGRNIIRRIPQNEPKNKTK